MLSNKDKAVLRQVLISLCMSLTGNGMSNVKKNLHTFGRLPSLQREQMLKDIYNWIGHLEVGTFWAAGSLPASNQTVRVNKCHRPRNLCKAAFRPAQSSDKPMCKNSYIRIWTNAQTWNTFCADRKHPTGPHGRQTHASWRSVAGRVSEFRPSVTSDGNDWVGLRTNPTDGKSTATRVNYSLQH
jgi:hypothetical protein